MLIMINSSVGRSIKHYFKYLIGSYMYTIIHYLITVKSRMLVGTCISDEIQIIGCLWFIRGYYKMMINELFHSFNQAYA